MVFCEYPILYIKDACFRDPCGKMTVKTEKEIIIVVAVVVVEVVVLVLA